jgi:predicted RNA methylase
MVQSVTCDNASVIADFAAGSGELIRQAQQRWPSATFLATDINKNIVSRLRRQNAGWLVGKCDFLNYKSRKLCSVTSALPEVSVVLLNPPFSCKGASRFQTHFRESTIRCSLALAFVFESLLFLKSGGQLAALLPAGSLTSEKDKHAWKVLDALYEIRTFGTNGRTTFHDCSAETVIVRLSRRKSIDRLSVEGPNQQAEIATDDLASIKIFRGKVPMYLTNGYSRANYLPLVHTTELSKEEIDMSARKVKPKWSAIRGPAVLLPRVGRPYEHKIKLYLSNDPLVLSDCVIALRCETSEQAKNLQSILLAKWDKLKLAYVGTCAKYITIKSLRFLLNSMGLNVALDSSKTALKRS